VKYMVLIYGNKATWEAMSEDFDDVVRTHGALLDELTESGELVGNGGLTTGNAKTVRVHNGVPAVTDGPFTEAKEVLAGYYLVDCESMERALAIATRVPEARFSPVEVRPLIEDPTGHQTGRRP
jgi:hypothetical protein